MSDMNTPPSSNGDNNFGLPPVPNPEGASTKPYSSDSGAGLDSYEKWLGPKGYKQFLSTLSQYMANEIKKNEQEEDLARRRLAAAEQGEDPSDVTM